MIIVIIAGGSGTRLWPLSTPDFPKQLLKLTNEKSMIQNTYERARALTDNVYIVPDISHAHHIKAQLSDVPDDYFITEPGRRGTANCIVAALSYLADRHGHDEPIAFIHADHHIRDVEGFVKSFRRAAKVSKLTDKVTLIGIKPTFPATSFGYIERDGDVAEDMVSTYKVASFTEKPSFKAAKHYVEAGNYLWNCGYFVGSLTTFLREMKRYAPQLSQNYDKLRAVQSKPAAAFNNTYLSFENLVIDLALLEKSKDLIVIPATFDWIDIGSFYDLHRANESDEFGNHFRGKAIYDDQVQNAYIRNEEDKPVVVIGLDNIVVINTPDGVLVTRKDLSQNVKAAVLRIQASDSK